MPNISILERFLFDFKPTEASLSRFRYWHVESLLNQSADLLDRCVRDRSDFYTLQEKADNFSLDQRVAEASIELAKKQIDQGFYDLDANRLSSEITVLTNCKALVASARQHRDQAMYLYDQLPGNWTGSIEGAAADLDQSKVNEQLHSMDISSKGFLLSKEKLGKQFFIESQDNLRRFTKEKYDLIYGPTGSLDLDNRINALKVRIKADFEDAYSRLVIAKKGMSLLYGYNEGENYDTFPSNNPEKGGADVFGPIDAALLWVRAAIRWLVSFGQLDQGFTKVFSIRYLYDLDWEKNINNGNEKCEFSFVLSADHFGEYAYVRMRGLSFSIISKKDFLKLPYQVDVELPKAAFVRHLVNDDCTLVNLTQDELPVCHFGRVDLKQSYRPAEVGGTVSQYNASPISDVTLFRDDHVPLIPQHKIYWRVSIEAPPGEKLSDVEDIILELNLVGIRMKNGRDQ